METDVSSNATGTSATSGSSSGCSVGEHQNDTTLGSKFSLLRSGAFIALSLTFFLFGHSCDALDSDVTSCIVNTHLDTLDNDHAAAAVLKGDDGRWRGTLRGCILTISATNISNARGQIEFNLTSSGGDSSLDTLSWPSIMTHNAWYPYGDQYHEYTNDFYANHSDFYANHSHFKIMLQSPLPAISDTTTLDGRMQLPLPGWDDAAAWDARLPRVVIDGSAVDSCTPGIRINADDVVFRGVAVVGFSGTGIYVAGARATLAEVLVAGNMLAYNDEDKVLCRYTNNTGTQSREGTMGAGIRFAESAVDSVVGIPASEHAFGTRPSFVYGNHGGVGIGVEAPRTTLNAVWVGITPQGRAGGNGGFSIRRSSYVGGNGVWFDPSAYGGRVGVDGSLARTYISGNKGVGLVIQAPRVTIVNTAIGLGPDGSCVPNGAVAGVYFTPFAEHGRVGIGGSHNLTYVSCNQDNGIESEAVGLTIDNAAVGLSFNGQAAGNGGCGVEDFATNTTIGNVSANGNTTFVGGNGGNGILFHARFAVVAGAWIGFDFDGSPAPNLEEGICLETNAADTIIGGGLRRTFIGWSLHGLLRIKASRFTLHHVSLGLSPHGEITSSGTPMVYVEYNSDNGRIGVDGSEYQLKLTGTYRTIWSKEMMDFYDYHEDTQTRVAIRIDGRRVTIANVDISFMQNKQTNVVLKSIATWAKTVNLDAKVSVASNQGDLTSVTTQMGYFSGVAFSKKSTNCRVGMDGSPNTTLIRAFHDSETTSSSNQGHDNFAAITGIVMLVVRGSNHAVTNAQLFFLSSGFGGQAATIGQCHGCRIGTDGSNNLTYFGGHVNVEFSRNTTLVNFACGQDPQGKSISKSSQLSVIESSNVRIGSSRFGNTSSIVGVGDNHKAAIYLEDVQNVIVDNVWVGLQLDGSSDKARKPSGFVIDAGGLEIYGYSTNLTVGVDGPYPVILANCLRDGIRVQSMMNLVSPFAGGLAIRNTLIGLDSDGHPAPNAGSGLQVSGEFCEPSIPINVGVDGSEFPVVFGCNALNHVRVSQSCPASSGTLTTIFNITNSYVGFGIHGEMINCTIKTTNSTNPSVQISVRSKIYIGTPNGTNQTFIGGGVELESETAGQFAISNSVIGMSKQSQLSPPVLRPLLVFHGSSSIQLGFPTSKPNYISGVTGLHGQNTISVQCPNVAIANTIIRASLLSTSGGILIGEEGADCTIGPGVRVENSSQYGVHAFGPRLTMVDSVIANNALGGVELEVGAAGSRISKCKVYGNGWMPQHEVHGGIVTSAGSTELLDNMIGKACAEEEGEDPNGGTNANSETTCKDGNVYYGIWSKETAVGSVVTGNVIRGSEWSGFRNDLVPGGLPATSSDNDIDDSNGRGLSACSANSVCDCSPYRTSETLVSVDCTEATGLGPNFPTVLPAKTALLDLANVDLWRVSWPELAALRAELRSLDLSGNPKLDPFPEAVDNNLTTVGFEHTTFNELVAVNLQGTNMSMLSNDSFAGLRPMLSYLDLSTPSVLPRNPFVSINLTGFKSLKVVALYTDACPAGFFDSNPDARSHFDRLTLCTRCGKGTYKPAGAGPIEACVACAAAGLFDVDDDPSTKCEVMPDEFSVQSYERDGIVYDVDADSSAGHHVAALVKVQLAYKVGCNISGIQIMKSSNQVGKVTFSVQGLPRGLLFEPSTAYIEGIPLVKPASFDDAVAFTVTLFAEDETGISVLVEVMTVEVLYEDKENVLNGPLGHACEHGGKVDDALPFDKHFECNCDDTPYIGQNCQTKKTNPWLAVELVTTAIGVVVVTVLAARLRRRRKRRNAPFSFDAMLDTLAAQQLIELQPVGSDNGVEASFSVPTRKITHSVVGDSVMDDVPLLGSGIDGNGSDDEELDLGLIEAVAAESIALQRWNQQSVVKAHGDSIDASGSSGNAAAGGGGGGSGGSGGSVDGGGVGANNSCAGNAVGTLRVPIEIRMENLEILSSLGSGLSGEVSLGLLHGGSFGVMPRQCAVKMSKGSKFGATNPEDREAMLKEAALMVQFDHPNVVRLLGVVTRNQQCLIVLELCELGSLHGLLLRELLHPNMSNTIDLEMVLSIAIDVGSAMSYLSSRRFVHRDVAARNVMLDKDFVCKLGDFGMSRMLAESKQYYYVQVGRGPFPLRWSAPEVVSEGKFTTASDTWSFGVMLFESMTRGEYPFRSCSNFQVMEMLGGSEVEAVMKGVFPLPFHAAIDIYEELVLPCWKRDRNARLAFDDIPFIVERIREGYFSAAWQDLSGASSDGSRNYLAGRLPGVVVRMNAESDTSDTRESASSGTGGSNNGYGSSSSGGSSFTFLDDGNTTARAFDDVSSVPRASSSGGGSGNGGSGGSVVGSGGGGSIFVTTFASEYRRRRRNDEGRRRRAARFMETDVSSNATGTSATSGSSSGCSLRSINNMRSLQTSKETSFNSN